MEGLLEDRGNAIFQIDFTRYLGGTFDQKALVEHLHKSRDLAFQGCRFPEATKYYSETLSGHLRDLPKCPLNRGCPLERGL